MSRRAWERRAIARGSEAQLLPRATMPREAKTILPAGPNRLLAATQLARVELAPANARGYRIGIQQGQRLMRWFPQARFAIAVKQVDRRLLLFQRQPRRAHRRPQTACHRRGPLQAPAAGPGQRARQRERDRDPARSLSRDTARRHPYALSAGAALALSPNQESSRTTGITRFGAFLS